MSAGAHDSFPGSGKVYLARYRTMAFELDFTVENELTYTAIEGPAQGLRETVMISPVQIRPGVFVINWQNDDGSTGVQVEDFDNEVVYTSITLPDGTFVNVLGSLKQIR